ncbi:MULTISPECIES: ribosome silencing factor [Pontibacter]|jgi:ribosome-associated protein|uniref:Ribosomal silencing factor RsfS n=2 Tax=Pontibacter TaxID=323449 RepID=A0A2U1B537_9BACT|nr:MULTISPECIES: ribosome silencing factor [Pontibacter]PVY43789.1 ribosome-associated protein [Pontibacter virosus]GGG18027.1 ribosomal silencing factor RsfS [Pontibacter amylolyticus]
MKETKAEANSDILAELVVKGMQEKKASNIVVLNLKSLKNAVSDYFVIASASSDSQLDAIASSIEEEIFKAVRQNPWQSEGRTNKEWVLLDYVDVVAHVFLKDKREFYALEELWGDANIKRIEDA